VVTEGFTGNIALKAAEGTARQIDKYLRGAMTQSIWSKLGYLLARGAFRAVKAKMDPGKANGGVFLGLNGIVIKSHGNTDPEGFANAVDIGYDMVRQSLLEKIRQTLMLNQVKRPVSPGVLFRDHEASVVLGCGSFAGRVLTNGNWRRPRYIRRVNVQRGIFRAPHRGGRRARRLGAPRRARGPAVDAQSIDLIVLATDAGPYVSGQRRLSAGWSRYHARSCL
jgi:hypothetical protein